MKTSSISILAAIYCLAVTSTHADPADRFREAQRIVVITQSEAIHYAQFCGFYELRELLADGISNVSMAVEPMESPLFEVKLLGQAGEITAHVGDHWIGTADGVALLPSARYDRLMEIVNNRKGSGVAEAKIDESIQRALKKIQDTAYIEQNMCASR